MAARAVVEIEVAATVEVRPKDPGGIWRIGSFQNLQA